MLNKQLTNLTEATYSYTSTAGAATIVTAAANTKGIRLRMVSMFNNGSTGYALLTIGGNIVAAIGSTGNTYVQEILLPAGQALATYLSAAGPGIAVWYELVT